MAEITETSLRSERITATEVISCLTEMALEIPAKALYGNTGHTRADYLNRAVELFFEYDKELERFADKILE